MDPQSPRKKSPILIQDADHSFYESPILAEAKSLEMFSPSLDLAEHGSETMAKRLRENIQTERERFNRQCEQIKAAIEQILKETERDARKGSKA